MMGRPMFPTAAARIPAARSMDSTIWVVVVFPLVPVTPSHGMARSGCCIRQASSISPHTGIPRSNARVSNRASGRHPGDVTTRSVSPGSSAVAPLPSRTVASRVSRMAALSAWTSDSSRTVTLAPSESSPSAAE